MLGGGYHGPRPRLQQYEEKAMKIVATRQLKGSYGLLATGETAEVDDEVGVSLVKRGLALEQDLVSYQTKVVSPEETKKHEAEIARMLADFPAYAPQIEEARISGSPLHLVAANIAAKEAQREADAAAEAKKLADAAAEEGPSALRSKAKKPDPVEQTSSSPENSEEAK
jgi:hypothetical protein